MAPHTQEGAGAPGPCTIGTSSALVPSDPAGSFWPYLFPSAVSVKPPAAELLAWPPVAQEPQGGLVLGGPSVRRAGWGRRAAGFCCSQHRAEVLPQAPPQRDPVPPPHTYTSW